VSKARSERKADEDDEDGGFERGDIPVQPSEAGMSFTSVRFRSDHPEAVAERMRKVHGKRHVLDIVEVYFSFSSHVERPVVIVFDLRPAGEAGFTLRRRG
jgi:hypothetical protein